MFWTKKLKKGASVQVNEGVKEVDTGIDMVGWQGRVQNIEDDFIFVHWDSITLKNLPDSYIERCEEEGLGWEGYNLGIDDVSIVKARDTLKDVEKISNELSAKFAWVYLGEEGKEINRIMSGIDIDDIMAQLDAWQAYLTKHIKFPFVAEVSEWQSSRNPLRGGDRVKVLDIELLDDMYGVIVTVQKKSQTFQFPLCDLSALKQKTRTYEVVHLYAVWFANR